MKPKETKMWAWWDNEDKQFCHVYSHKQAVGMCFPYGYKAEEELGRGKLMPVIVIEDEDEARR